MGFRYRDYNVSWIQFSRLALYLLNRTGMKVNLPTNYFVFQEGISRPVSGRIACIENRQHRHAAPKAYPPIEVSFCFILFSFFWLPYAITADQIYKYNYKVVN